MTMRKKALYEDRRREMIKIVRNCNCHITFANGVTVSILIGGGSYSDNHDDIDLIGKEREKKKIISTTAEVAAWKYSSGIGREWITKELCPNTDDDVIGWQTPEQILEFLNKAANYKETRNDKKVSDRT